MAEVEYNKYLPAYRSLLNPTAKYDYKTHLLVPLSQLELKTIVARFQLNQLPQPFKMKYRSLLSDVLRKALILLLKVRPKFETPATLRATQSMWKRCKSFSQLPVEIQMYVFSFVADRDSFRTCLATSRRFYHLAKPFLYREVSFTSTYRLAQFVTSLRLNPTLGCYVVSLDLLQLKPGNYELELMRDEHEDPVQDEHADDPAAALAGWRDWKYKNNPLYSLHPAVPLTRTLSNSSASNVNMHKHAKLSKYFRRRASIPLVQHPAHLCSQPSLTLSHPRINRFLTNYSASKDVPVGYVLHLINLCPNLEELNMGSLLLLTDYRIVPAVALRYQTYDLTTNYHKDLLKIIDLLLPLPIQTSNNPFENEPPKAVDPPSLQLSVFSLSFSKPIRKYNSLLPPSPSVTGMLFLSRGDGRLYLSDLNLRAINTAHLEIVLEAEVFRALERRPNLRRVNLSSLIWISLKLVRDYLLTVLAADIQPRRIDGKDYLLYRGRYFAVGELLQNDDDDSIDDAPGALVLDLLNSGMYTNLQWAQRIDTRTRQGQKLVHRIINDELVSPFEEYIIRERIRRGRIGENYFS